MVTLLLVFNSFILPIKKAEAAFWVGAIPAGITVGGGAYALGALAVGSLATGLGIQYGEEISNSASKVWKSSTDLAKKSLEVSMQAVVDTGNTIQKVGSDFASWVTTKAGQLAGLALNASQGVETAKSKPTSSKESTSYTDTTTKIVVTTAYPEAVVVMNSYDPQNVRGKITVTFPTTGTDFFVYMSAGNNTATDNGSMVALRELSIELGSTGKVIVTGRNFASGSIVYPSRDMRAILTGVANYTADSWLDYTFTGMDGHQILGLMLNIYTAEQMIDSLKRLGLDNVSLGNQDMVNKWGSLKQQLINQDIPRMKDAGLVLPVNDVLPLGSTGQTLTYNPTDTTFLNPDGTIYTGEVTYTTPGVNVVEVDGVPVVVTPVEGVPTNVYTGEPVVTTPPPTDGGTTTPRTFDMRPLVLLGEQIRGKFPFSIPWDVFNLFNQLNVEPVTPVFKISSGDGITLGGKNINVNYDFDIDFSIFDPIAKIMRWGLILVFDIAIILALRRLTPD